MAEITLEALGISKDDLTDKLLDRLVEEFTTEVVWDEDGEKVGRQSSMSKQIKQHIINELGAAVKRLADQHVLPRVNEMVEGLVIQQTNSYGEKVGKPVTFIEYLTARADAYMREEVSYDGKTKAEDTYNWRKHSTRIAYMVDRHLQFSIDAAMKKALADANSAIVGGLEGAVKVALANATAALKVAVTAK